MDINKTNDATFEINLNNSKIKRYKDEELKKLARKQKRLKVRIVKVKLKKWNHRSIIYQFTKRNSITRRIKTIIRRTMDNRKRLWQIKKNKLCIEKFTGRRRTIIEQDFYSHIFLLNLLIGIKHDAELKIKRKPKQTAKYTYEYHSNVNVLIGKIKDQLPRLLTDNQEQIQQVIQEIMEIGSKELVATKIPAPTNEERDKEKYWNKNCKTSKSEGF